MSVHAVEAVGELVHEAEVDTNIGVVVAVEEQQADHSMGTFAARLWAADSAGVAYIAAGKSSLSASRQGTCCVALPRLHPPVSSSRSCACSADV